MATAKKVPAKKAPKNVAEKSDLKMTPAPGKSEAQPVTSTTTSAKEVLGTKLRAKSEIVTALQKGGELLLGLDGLFRMINTDGSKNRISKRRANAMISKKELNLGKQTGQGRLYVLAMPGEKKETATSPGK